jgi:glycosyltransferase involved in cell wall biosynthesis
MLSVLIPTYEYECCKLVSHLYYQLRSTGYPYEIIVVDDGSKNQASVIANMDINQYPRCRFIRRTENVGRAAIKNFLAREAKGEWLLYIDSDAEVRDPCYIRMVIDAIKHDSYTQVIIGGLYHTKKMPSPDVSLRFRYERAADRHRFAMERRKTPYLHITPFNLCIQRSVMLSVMFDEQCKEYGYEDALFGITLQQRGIKVRHIDNPLMHRGLESNTIYLAKAETALQTLNRLGDLMMPYSHVGQAAIKLQRWHMQRLAIVLFRLFHKIMRYNLLGKRPNLTIFSLYKLGYLCTILPCKKSS